MSKIKTYNELEHTANLKLKIAGAEREIDLATKNHINEMDQIKSGYDLNGNKINCSVQERLDMMANSSKEYINNYADHNEELVNIESALEEDDEICSNEVKKESVVRKPKRNYFAATVIGLATALALSTISVTAVYCNHEAIVSNKTEKYAEDLEQVVDNATYTRIGNLVYQNGVVVETLEEEKSADHEYTYIDYSDIASYIEHSDNPELAVFTLYKNFGRTNNPTYHRIVTNTFKSLEFDGSEIGSSENFIKYINASGYEGYNEYYKSCRKELYTDSDSELDNIKTKIKKMTK